MGSPGETYTIRHDTIDRKAYMPEFYKQYEKSIILIHWFMDLKIIILNAHSNKQNQVSKLIPSVGTGGQFKYALEIPGKYFRG